MPQERRIEIEDGLFDCFADGGTACITAMFSGSFVPTVIAAGRMQWWSAAVCLALVSLLYSYCLIRAKTVMNDIDAQQGRVSTEELQQGQMAMLFIYTALSILVIVLACLRTAIIRKYRETTDEDGCMSCAQACCCTACLAAQVMRWTDGRFDEKYHAVDTDIEMISPHKKAQEYLDQAKKQPQLARTSLKDEAKKLLEDEKANVVVWFDTWFK